jgi:hypothetical protein
MLQMTRDDAREAPHQRHGNHHENGLAVRHLTTRTIGRPGWWRSGPLRSA